MTRNNNYINCMKRSIKCFGAKIFNRIGIVQKYDTSRNRVRILMYHKINETQDCLGLSVTPKLFENQMRYISDNYEIISLSDAVFRLTSGSLTSNYCVLTFDDGYRDNCEIAAPILESYNLPATIFVTYEAIETGWFGWGGFDRTLLTTQASKIDLTTWSLGIIELNDMAAREQAVVWLHRELKKLPDVTKREVVDHVVTTYGEPSADEREMMTWEEVRKLASNGLITIGAHTVTHPILSRVSLEQSRYEIVEGKSLIEKRLGHPVEYFAYPNGGRVDFRASDVELVQQAGYKGACTTIAGHNVPGENVWELKRVDVTSSMSTDSRQQFSPDLFALSLSGMLSR